MLRHARHKAKLFGLLQTFGRDRTAGADHHGGRHATGIACRAGAREGHRTTFETCLTPQHSRLATGNGKAVFGKTHYTTGLGQFGCVRDYLYLVTAERDAALHRRLVKGGDGQGQFQLVIGASGCRRLAQDTPGHRSQRGTIDNTQHLTQRTTRFGIDSHCCMTQIGNQGLHLADLQAGGGTHPGTRAPDLKLRTVNHQFATELHQSRPGQGILGLDTARHVGIGCILNVG